MHFPHEEFLAKALQECRISKLVQDLGGLYVSLVASDTSENFKIALEVNRILEQAAGEIADLGPKPDTFQRGVMQSHLCLVVERFSEKVLAEYIIKDSIDWYYARHRAAVLFIKDHKPPKEQPSWYVDSIPID